jgi:hypothetical protein
MRLVCVTAQTWQISTRLTVGLGAQVIVCPPVTADTIDLSLLEQSDVLYIRLHGVPGQPYLYGDPGMVTALSRAQIEGIKLPGTLVFLEGCFGTLMADAFLEAGARSVVGSTDTTYGKRIFLGESSQFGKAWLSAIKKGFDMMQALDHAFAATQADARLWKITGSAIASLSNNQAGGNVA